MGGNEKRLDGLLFIGFEYAFMGNLSATARMQHMSNAGIYSSNPGVNLVMIGLRYKF